MTCKSNTAVVTGAAGFIGAELALQRVARGDRVLAIGHGGLDELTTKQKGIAQWLNADVTIPSMSALLGGSQATIYHCAGGSSVARSVDNPYLDFRRTVASLSEVLEYMRLHSPTSRLVYVSSAAVYGDTADPLCAEPQQPNPQSPYGLHKLQAEQLCSLYARQYGLDVAIVRLFSVYGPGLRKQLLWDACRKLMVEPDQPFWGSGLETRDWLHVGDAVSLIELVASQAGKTCPVFNGGRGLAVEVRAVIEQLAEYLGVARKPVFNGIWKKGDPVNLVADIERAKSIGWVPKTDWKDGLREYVQWVLSLK